MADKYDSFANKMLDSKDFNISDASFESILKDICKKNDSFKSLALLEEDFSNPLNVYCPSGARSAVAAAMATKKPVVLVVPSGRDALESVYAPSLLRKSKYS